MHLFGYLLIDEISNLLTWFVNNKSLSSNFKFYRDIKENKILKKAIKKNKKSSFKNFIEQMNSQEGSKFRINRKAKKNTKRSLIDHLPKYSSDFSNNYEMNNNKKSWERCCRRPLADKTKWIIVSS